MATVEQKPSPSRDGSAGIPVDNPASGEIITTVPSLTPEQVKEMVARARAAQPGWHELGFDGRAKIFMRAQKWVLDNADRVIDVVCSETGKTYEDAQLAEVSYGANAFGFWAKKAPEYLADERVHSSNPFVLGKKLITRYAPLGVVGVIGPWNFPLTNSFGDCIPALAAGNSVVLKPAQVTPLTSLLMLEMMRDCELPEHVFQVATGDGSVTGAALIDEVDYIMFTGSTNTGKKVMERAAKTLTPVGLELGGKDPMIVCSDADIERAANAATFYSMNNGGQVCISIERVYVEEPVYDEFVGKVAEKVGQLRQGGPTAPASAEVGAVIFPPQLDVIDAHVKDAVKKGARVLTGGKPASGPGRFYEPTVIADANHTMECMTEETFGPTLPIMKVGSAEEAIGLANESPYGLASSVFTKDVAKGERIARQIEAGVCCVNDAQMNYAALELPMGGWKASGLGSRHGPGGIRKYCAQQSILVTRFAPKRDVHMFPYKARRTKLLGRIVRFMYGRGERD